MRTVTSLGERFGYRGLWLMLAGVAWILFGFGVWQSHNPPRPWVLHEILPDLLQACGWWVTGAVAIWHGLRGPGRPDWRGHVALYLMPALRVLSYGLSWVAWLISDAMVRQGIAEQTVGFDKGYYAALLWLMLSVLLAVASAWPNPAPPLPMPPPSDRDGDADA